MGIIYCYTNKINQKKYIGQTINPEQRKSQHKSSAFNSNDAAYATPLHKAFRKYGYENFEYKILVTTEYNEELNDLEAFFITKYNTLVPDGYNVNDGGGSHAQSEEVKEKLRWMHASLTEEEVIKLRIAYREHKSPKEIYNSKYSNKMHFQSFMNIWTGKRYKTVMPEVFFDKGQRSTKLTEDLVKQIRQEYKENQISYQKLADKYNVSKGCIADLINRRTWRDV